MTGSIKCCGAEERHLTQSGNYRKEQLSWHLKEEWELATVEARERDRRTEGEAAWPRGVEGKSAKAISRGRACAVSSS